VVKKRKGQQQVQSSGRIKSHVGHPIRYRKLSTVKNILEHIREDDPRHTYGFRKVEGGYGIYKSAKRR